MVKGEISNQNARQLLAADKEAFVRIEKCSNILKFFFFNKNNICKIRPYTGNGRENGSIRIIFNSVCLCLKTRQCNKFHENVLKWRTLG